MRKIVYHADFDDQLRQAELEFPGIEASLAGLKRILARSPDFGTQISASPSVWFVGAPDLFPVPLGITYTFDDANVYFLVLWIDSDHESN